MIGLVLVVAIVGVGLVALLGNARASARESDTLECNGSADYCDRRLDQVVLPGSHNSMSAASDPGWLFAENLTGIPTQLEYGIRALLVKSHYGTPTGVDIGGAELVVTDTAAEADNDQQDEVAELSAAAVARAQQLEASVPTPAAPSEIYLCHVYCSLGATKFSDTLLHLRRFLDRNPGEVVMLFIGDYVSPEDTATAFEQAKLLDRLWTYDTTKPPPTLREMVEARRTLLVLAEHNGGTPAWYTKGYGIFQDTPYTFADAPAVQLRQEPRSGRCAALRAQPLHHQQRAALGHRGAHRERLRRADAPGRAVHAGAGAAPQHHRRRLLRPGRPAEGRRGPERAGPERERPERA